MPTSTSDSIEARFLQATSEVRALPAHEAGFDAFGDVRASCAGRGYRVVMLADSIGTALTGPRRQPSRLCTFRLRYPRFLLPQVNTHRAFSRISKSSRATSTERLIEQVRTEPAGPLFWTAQTHAQAMTPGAVLPSKSAKHARLYWLEAASAAAQAARDLAQLDAAKEAASRVLEPYLWAETQITTDQVGLEHFFSLRRSKHAQLEIRFLAELMHQTHQASTPHILHRYNLHLPHVTPADIKACAKVDIDTLDISHPAPAAKSSPAAEAAAAAQDLLHTPAIARVAAARSARISYSGGGKVTDIEGDLRLFARLTQSRPRHLSPLEHVCICDPLVMSSANLHDGGFVQLRRHYEPRRL